MKTILFTVAVIAGYFAVVDGMMMDKPGRISLDNATVTLLDWR